MHTDANGVKLPEGFRHVPAVERRSDECGAAIVGASAERTMIVGNEVVEGLAYIARPGWLICQKVEPLPEPLRLQDLGNLRLGSQ